MIRARAPRFLGGVKALQMPAKSQTSGRQQRLKPTLETNAMRMLSPPTYRATGAHRGQGLLVTKTG